jgi:hypothetical protein
MTARQYAKSRGIHPATFIVWIRKGVLDGAWSKSEKNESRYKIDVQKADEIVQAVIAEKDRVKAEQDARKAACLAKAMQRAERKVRKAQPQNKGREKRNPFCEHYAKCLSKAAWSATRGRGKLNCRGCPDADIRPVQDLSEIR